MVDIHTYGMEKWHGEADKYVEQITVNHKGTKYCARCKGEHDTLDWKRITNPVLSGPEGARASAIVAWAMCPTLHEPIFIEAWEHIEP